MTTKYSLIFYVYNGSQGFPIVIYDRCLEYELMLLDMFILQSLPPY